MDHLHDHDLSPPPPAYSEQEFDQKISLASQQSLISYQNHVEREADWEVWDDVQFEEAAARIQKLSLQGSSGMHEIYQAGTSTSLNCYTGLKIHTPPLRIHKRNPSGGRPSVPSGKPKPSWLSEAEGDTSGASSSRTVYPFAVPVYTAASDSEPSSAALSPAPALQNPYGSCEWRPTSPVPTLPDPHTDQDASSEGHSDVLPASTDESLPPPPFSSDLEGHLVNPQSEVSPIHVSPALSATLTPGPPSRGGSSPAYSPNPDLNLTSENSASTIQPPQQRQHVPLPNNFHFQPTAAASSMSSQSRHSTPQTAQAMPLPQTSSPSYFHSVSYRPQGYNPNRNTAFPPQTITAPRINVDLSTVYGKRPAGPIIQDTQPPPVFSATAFYNSAVSAHLGTAHAKQMNPSGPKRQSHQPPSTSSIYNFPQAARSMPGRYFSPSTGPAHGQYNPRPFSQDPLIRSPTPTYPTGAANPMPQMLAAANEGCYGHQQPMSSYSTGRGQATWTEPFNPYR